MTSMIVPGVRVQTRFDVLPPLPAAAGIVGIVGVVDRPQDGPIGLTQLSEAETLLGPGTRHSLPELTDALSNGASEVVVSAVGGGAAAATTLLNADGNPAVRLRCRSHGAWANAISAEVRTIRDGEGNPIRVTVRLTRQGRVLEEYRAVRLEPGASDDLVFRVNAESSLCVAQEAGLAGVAPTAGDYDLDEGGEPVDVPVDGDVRVLMSFSAAPGVSPADISVNLSVADGRIRLVVSRDGAELERIKDLSLDPDDAQGRYLFFTLERESQFIRARAASSIEAAQDRLPRAGRYALQGGTSPLVDDYRTAIGALVERPRVDLVLASVQTDRAAAEVHQIHQALRDHAIRMADAGAPRVAFGSVTDAEADDVAAIEAHAAQVRHRRFVLVAPPGGHGAVAGRIASYQPETSPTFKAVSLGDIAPSTYRESQLNRLLGPNINLLVVQARTGRGVVVLRGLDTSGDQVSVTRVADQTVRETRAISEGYIGRLNTVEARSALRQAIIARLTAMERRGALVPSADGEDPAFVINAYSTNQDFANGIVRVDLAVRPARAIDFIYATIRVKNV